MLNGQVLSLIDKEDILSDVKTLTLEEAAELLKIHPVTLSVKAAAGEIPAAKIGKRWVFLSVDLVEHIRAKYKVRALQGDRKEILCHFTSAQTPVFGGSKSPSLEKQYKELLGLPQKAKLRNSTTS